MLLSLKDEPSAMDINPGVPDFSNKLGFTPEQWTGIILSGLISSIVSLIANLSVITIHLILTWFRPYIVNRLSLRMIVVACALNCLYCISQIATDSIPSDSNSCRAFAYLIVSTDTMSCMCLAMVGLNLVSIFVFKFPRSVVLEVVYYLIVALSGILVAVIPAFAGSKKGPNHNSHLDDQSKTCWYHYYFEGRMQNIFNWMWYYGWLMFSLVFAAICAAVSIRYVARKQKNFTGALNIFARRKKDIHTMTMLKKYANNDTDIFRRIARRCVCYPLVPFFSKPWGVAIEIAAALQKNAPYPIFVIDRVLGSLFGIYSHFSLMVACIYVTDPAINAVFKEFADILKTKYVYEYFHVQYYPRNDVTINNNPSCLKSVEVVPILRDDRDFTSSQTELSQRAQLPNETNETEEISAETLHQVADSSHIISAYSLGYSEHYLNFELPGLYNQPQQVAENYRVSNRRYSVVKVTMVDQTSVFPNEGPNEEEFKEKRSQNTIFSRFSKIDKGTAIPMRRLSSIPSNSTSKSFEVHQRSIHSTTKLIPFENPVFARFMHWVFTRIFMVSPVEFHDFENANNTFHQETEAGIVRSANHNHQQISVEKLQQKSSTEESLVQRGHETGNIAPLKRQLSEIHLETDSLKMLASRTSMPVRRASSINVATLQRQRLKDELQLSNPSPVKTPSGQSSKSVAVGALKNRSVLSRVLGRRLSSNVNKFSRGKTALNKAHLMSEISMTASATDTEQIQKVNDSPFETLLSDPNTKATKVETHKEPSVCVDMGELDLGLSVYPSELAPRPVSQYTIHSATKKANPKRESSHSGQRLTFDKNSVAPINSLNQDHSFNPNELLYDTKRMHSGMGNLDNLAGQDSNCSTPKTEQMQSISMQDQCSGFTYGSTTVHNISNWQTESNNDEDRLIVITESWDIQEQLKQQLKLASDIINM